MGLRCPPKGRELAVGRNSPELLLDSLNAQFLCMRKVNQPHAILSAKLAFASVEQLRSAKSCLTTKQFNRPKVLFTLILNGEGEIRDEEIESLIAQPVKSRLCKTRVACMK